MKKTIEWVILAIFLVGLITIFYWIFKFSGWIGVIITFILALLGIPKTPQSVEIPKESINKTKEFRDDLEKMKEKQKVLEEEAENLKKEMETFLEELKKGGM